MSNMSHPTPTLTPVLYDAGLDWKLIEANGWSPERLRPHHARLFIVKGEKGWFVVDSWDCSNALSRPRVEGEPIAFYYRDTSRECCPSAEDALALAAEYLNQPLNPYTWLCEHADPE